MCGNLLNQFCSLHSSIIKFLQCLWNFYSYTYDVSGDAMNSFINDNWRHVIKDMRPVLEQTIGEVVKDLFNGIYTKFPLEDILPNWYQPSLRNSWARRAN